MTGQNCAYCNGQPLTNGFAHAANCPLTPGPFATATITAARSYSDRVMIARLRRKLKCIVSDYEYLGVIEAEALEAARALLAETECYE